MRRKVFLKKLVGITVVFSLAVSLLPQNVSAENPIVQNVYTADPAPIPMEIHCICILPMMRMNW